jgi:thimet oligopeptidase
MNEHLPEFSKITVDFLEQIYLRQLDNVVKYNDLIASLDLSTLNYQNCLADGLKQDSETVLEDVLLDLDQLHPDKDIRDKSVELGIQIQTFMVEQNMRRDVFKVIDHYYNNQYQQEKNILSPEQNKFVTQAYNNYCNLGLNLPDEQYNRVKEIKKQLGVNSSKYNQNISEENTVIYLKREDLEGLSEEWLNSRFNEIDDNYTVKLQYTDYNPIMEYCVIRETRKMLNIAYASRCHTDNMEIILETIRLRKERANIFGFESHTDYKLQQNMASNSQVVNKFLSGLLDKLKPLTASDLSVLRELAKELDGLTDIKAWDISYYTRIYTEKITKLDQRELAKLFTIDSVTNGIFSIYQELLGLVFTEVTLQFPNSLYAPDIKLFMVSDKSECNKPLGYFYLDLFPRDGKYSHAAMFTIVSKSEFNLPVSAIVCNFDPELDVEFDNVVTFFHEFGHLMHNMVSTNTISCLAGTACQRDFVETPSQMFERWCYCLEPLKRLVKQDKLSMVTEELVSKINAQSKVLQGIFNSRQVAYGLLDAAIHSSNPPEDTWVFFNELIKNMFGYELEPGCNMLANWGHMYGYDAQYYGYQWSLVYAVDLFSFFKDKYLDKELGMKLREKVLAVGGTKSGLEILRDFMDREPDADAFINWLIG